jgi:DNA ligase (NAD+)
MDCPGTQVGLLLKFCRTVGIDEVGPSVAAALCGAGLVNPADIYGLDSTFLAEVPMGGGRIGEARAKKIVESIDSKREMTFGEMLGALGVEGCSTSVMSAVAKRFPDPDRWRWEPSGSLTRDELLAVSGVGPERADAIVRFISLRWTELVLPLLDQVELVEEAEGPLSGMAFCITLELRSGSRTEMEARIRRAGGEVKSSVTRDVTHLVCNVPDAGTSKHRRAIDLGIPIIDEDRLVEMMGDGQPAEVQPSEEDPF